MLAAILNYAIPAAALLYAVYLVVRLIRRGCGGCAGCPMSGDCRRAIRKKKGENTHE